MKKYLRIFLIALVVLGITAGIFCCYAESVKTEGQSPAGTVPVRNDTAVKQAFVEDLSSEKYFPKVKEALAKAKSSIYMMM